MPIPLDALKVVPALKGSSVAANCLPCLAHDASEARESGAQQRDIDTAIAVGRTDRKGPAFKMDGFVETAVSRPIALANDAQAYCGCSELIVFAL